MMKNKMGWIRIVEAFVSILLITGAILIVINKGYIKTPNITEKVYDTEVAVLREIELNDELRKVVLDIPQSRLPVKWDDENFPLQIREIVNSRIPEYLECSANICALKDICGMADYIEKDVYVQAVAIAANIQTYSPRQIKLFCWQK